MADQPRPDAAAGYNPARDPTGNPDFDGDPMARAAALLADPAVMLLYDAGAAAALATGAVPWRQPVYAPDGRLVGQVVHWQPHRRGEA